MARSEKLYQRQMIPASDYDKDRFAYPPPRRRMPGPKADLERILAGTWKEDLEVAQAAVVQAQSQVESIQIGLERLTVRALTDGEVLQVNVRPGQFAAMAWQEPMIVLGDVNRLHVRVDIDENDLPMFERGAEAIATLKGKPQVRFPLEFVKVEPYVIPKKSLTGDNTERVDTRVLQVDLRPARRAAGARLRRPADGRLPEGGHPPRGAHARGRPRRQIAVRGRGQDTPRAEGGIKAPCRFLLK